MSFGPYVACAALLLACVGVAAAAPFAPFEFPPSQLVLLRPGMPGTGGMLAQRAIDREWGASDDSLYVEKEVSGWRSESGAMLLSAVLPGAGQAYSDDKYRGLWFALAELAGWTSRLVLRRSGDRVRGDAAAFAGVPTDSTSSWSFTRWTRAAHTQSAELEHLYDELEDEKGERLKLMKQIGTLGFAFDAADDDDDVPDEESS